MVKKDFVNGDIYIKSIIMILKDFGERWNKLLIYYYALLVVSEWMNEWVN